MFIALMALLIALYPLIVYELLSSTLAALLAPIALLQGFSFIHGDVYWIGAWALLVGLPLLSISTRLEIRRAMPILLGVMLIASFASSVRSFSGLPLLISAIGILLVKERARTRQAAYVSVLVLAYLAISPGLVGAVMQYRDHALTGQAVAPPVHPTVWHTIYIGLGYLDNPYGIRYEDSVAYSHAQAADPTVQYLGPTYGEVLRGLFLRLVASDPGFLVETILFKLLDVFWTAVNRFGLALLVVPIWLSLPGRRSLPRTSLLLALPAIAYGLTTPLVAMPYVQYEMTWLAVWGYIAVLGMAWIVGVVPLGLAWVIDTCRSDGPAATRRLVPRKEVLALAAVFIACLYPLSNIGDAIERRMIYRQSADRLAIVEVTGTPIVAWRMNPVAASAWQIFPEVEAALSGQDLLVATTDRPFDYQLAGPTVSLPTGHYRVLVDGKVLTGGMDIGVLDVAKSSWLIQGLYWHGQFERASPKLSVEFGLAQPTDIRVILANWQPKGGPSNWAVRQVTLERVPSP
jgi:hypothetical protein